MGWLGSCSEGPSSCQEASLLGLLFPPLSCLTSLRVWSGTPCFGRLGTALSLMVSLLAPHLGEKSFYLTLLQLS